MPRTQGQGQGQGQRDGGGTGTKRCKCRCKKVTRTRLAFGLPVGEQERMRSSHPGTSLSASLSSCPITSLMHLQSYSFTRYEYSPVADHSSRLTAPRQARLPQAPVVEQSVDARVVDLHVLVLTIQKAEALNDYERCRLGSPRYTVRQACPLQTPSY